MDISLFVSITLSVMLGIILAIHLKKFILMLKDVSLVVLTMLCISFMCIAIIGLGNRFIQYLITIEKSRAILLLILLGIYFLAVIFKK